MKYRHFSNTSDEQRDTFGYNRTTRIDILSDWLRVKYTLVEENKMHRLEIEY